MTNPSEVKTISCQQLHEASLDGPIDLIDVRTREEFHEIHAVGARNLPLDTLTPASVNQSRTAQEQHPLYFICAVGGRSAWACEMMMAAGYNDVVNVEGGTQAWYLAGLPVERGSS
ncbi:MAG TPA: rhodanese-like domain-containing protein [Lacipirellulaceae bacterium]|jgi:rhodanese-related sulfurtransferase|nr:rhodanese-like domain-containing protein [Lacipirellulaceae bacterium]